MIDLVKWSASVPLKGNEPQIKWAKQIRQKRAMEVQKMGLRQWALAVKPHVVEADLEKMHCTTQKAVAQFVMAVVMYMFNCREAVWWISHRNESPSTWFQPSTKACVEYFSKKNHFK